MSACDREGRPPSGKWRWSRGWWEGTPGKGSHGGRECGTFQKQPEGKVVGSESEGELVGGEVAEGSCLDFILSNRNHLEF